MSDFDKAVTQAMTSLGGLPQTVFLGQSVAYPGTSMHVTLEGVPASKRIEMPVAEDLQMGISIGLSLEGFLPVSIYPRWNFLLCAANQLVNHLDRIPLYSEYRPRVIVRTARGRRTPLDPGPQHADDFTDGFELMLRTVRVRQANRVGDVGPLYSNAVQRRESTLIVECPKE